MGNIYPLPPDLPFAQLDVHGHGTLLKYLIMAMNSVYDALPRTGTATFGDYHGAQSIFRHDLAHGVGVRVEGDPPIPKYIDEIVSKNEQKPLVQFINAFHGQMRGMPQPLWACSQMVFEEFDDPDNLSKRIRDKILAHTKYAKEMAEKYAGNPKALEDALKNTPHTMELEIQQLLHRYGPEALPRFWIFPERGKYDVSDPEEHQQIWVPNDTPLVAHRPKSYPAIVLAAAKQSGQSMVDVMRIPDTFKAFLLDTIGNEADITLAMMRLVERIMEANPGKEAMIKELVKIDLEKVKTPAANAAGDLAKLYHVLQISGIERSDTVEAVRRLYAFASGDNSAIMKPIPFKVHSLQDAQMFGEAFQASLQRLQR